MAFFAKVTEPILKRDEQSNEEIVVGTMVKYMIFGLTIGKKILYLPSKYGAECMNYYF